MKKVEKVNINGNRSGIYEDDMYFGNMYQKQKTTGH